MRMVSPGHVGHHGGRRHWRREGVHQEVDKYCLGHVIHHLYLFFVEKSNENDFKYLKVMLVTMVDIDDGDQEESFKLKG